MKLSKDYILQTLYGISYLLPYGQAIAEHRRGVRLNETGVFLWEKLKAGYSRIELLENMAEYYEASPNDLTILKKDLEDFLSQLIAAGILIDDMILPKPDCYFRIADITIGYSGNKDLLLPSIFDFSCDAPTEDEWKEMQKKQLFILSAAIPQKKTVGKILIKTEILEIIEDREFYILNFPQQNHLKSCRISNDGKRAYFYIQSTVHAIQTIFQEPLELKQELFYAFRDVFLFFAQKHGLFAIHSASLLYHNKAWLFSGPSGTGKSTHTSLWKKQYHTPLLNGDLNLCKATKNNIICYGMPWCGTSGIYTKKEYPIGGIILLRQDAENTIETLSLDQQQLLVSQRLISPSWTETLFLKNLAFADNAVKQIPVFRLACNMEDAAAATAKAYIDKNCL